MRLYRKDHLVLVGLLLLQGILAGQSMAQDKATIRAQARARVAAVETFPTEQVLDINNITTWIEDGALFSPIDHFSHLNGSFPKNSTTGGIYAQGIVWGGLVSDGRTPSLRVNGSTYADGLQPGKVLRSASGQATGPDTYTPEKYHVWRVHRNWTTLNYNQAASSYFGVALAAVTEEQRTTIREWYEYDWLNWPADMGAPYDERNSTPGYQPASDANGNGTYEPEEGDIPGYPGADQTVWLVTNDLGAGVSEELYGSPAIGIEYQLTLWGYDFPSTSPLGNITFAQARLIYTGTPATPAGSRIDSMFVSQWADPDVGDFGDDFAGSDTLLSLGYAYNSASSDAQYQNLGLAPAAVGWDFFQGPITEEGDTLGMTSFVYFAAGSTIEDPELGEYTGTQEWFNLMRGLRPQPPYPAGVPFTDPFTGDPSKFTLTGDPVSGTGWIDGQELPPGDRRIVLVTGPFTMELGDTVDVVIGQIGAIGSNNLSSVSLLRYYDSFAQFSYDNDFVLPSAPVVPPVSAAELDNEIVLNWSIDPAIVRQAETSFNAGFAFEGYNVYQLPSANAPLSQGVKVATFDKQNDITFVVEPVFDEETGFVFEKPVVTLPNAGLQRFVSITRDQIRGRPLANGVPYYFALTSFSVLDDPTAEAPFRLLESTPIVVEAIPQPERPGLAELPAPGQGIEVEHLAGSSTSDINVQIVDPTLLQSGDYEIRFAYYNPATGEAQDVLAEGDTLTAEMLDGLFEATSYAEDHQVHEGDPFPLRYAVFRDGTQVSEWLPQFDPAGPIPLSEAPIVEGLQVQVPYVLAGIASWTASGTRWVTGVNTSGNTDIFFGGALIGSAFLGSTLPDDELIPVRLEFQAAEDTLDGWAGVGTTFIRGSGYAAHQNALLPFAAYEINPDGSNGRRLNVSFVQLSDACNNMRWDMGLLHPDQATCGPGDGLGAREYILIHATDYNEGADYDAPDDRFEDVVYGIWPTQRGSQPFGDGQFTMEFHPAIANVPADQFAFAVEAAETGNEELLAASVDDINVFPNPYLGASRIEANRFNKFVTFTHLPERATIRIFNLAGIMVRIIEHEDPSQFERWDLNNQDGIPVASGVYVVHVDTEHGEKVLKVALVTEQQVLQRY